VSLNTAYEIKNVIPNQKNWMKLLNIEFKNIGGYGNKLQTLTFDSDGKLILLKGISGAGKSTLLNMPSLLFYGKVEKLAKSSIANRINKNGYIRGTIVEGSDEYIIERTFSPNSITVYKNDVDIKSIGVKDAQDYINDNIIKVPYQIFTNIISLSAKKFKSFLNMGAEDRRQIIDRVFNLEMVNEIYNLIKKDIKDIGLAINTDNSQIFTLNNTINNAQMELNNLSQSSSYDTNGKIQANQKIIESATKEVEKLNLDYQKYYNEYNEQNLKWQEKNNIIIQSNNGLTMLNEKITLLSNDQCPTCGTSFEGDDFKELKKKLVNQKNLVEANKIKVTEEMTAIATKMQELSGKCNEINVSIQTYNQQITQAQAENNAFNEAVKNNAEYKSIQKIIDDNKITLMKVQKQLDDDNEKIADLQTLMSLYTLDGVKSVIIKSYLPQLNKEIRHTLERLNFPYQLTFNQSFDGQVTDLGEEIPSDTLSDGEHARIDLAVICSIFKLLKRKYPTINIFTLDEFLSSLDSVTAAALLRYLKDFALEQKLNIYVVSHVDMESELFDEQLEVFKEMKFSDIEKTV
jgi:DNA repair exonuclease SbcCD ATPase subunit